MTGPPVTPPPARPKQIHVSLLEMATISHNNYGLWRHPDNQKWRYRDVAFWVELAQICEAAKLDSIFQADLIGVAAGYQGSTDVPIREGMHIPINDPLLVQAAMASSTTHLGFATTVSATYEHPFGLARRMSTLDHLTNGRAGWNIVMSYTPNANENYGLDTSSLTSVERYDRAEEFMEICYRLWESSWEDGAVIMDRERGFYTDPSKVHRIDYVGQYYRCAGPHLCEPSPQRTPVLFQAGMSDRGRRFAATHAEVTFVSGRSPDALRMSVRDIRRVVAEQGRRPEDMKVLSMVSIVVAPTTEEAEAKLEEYVRLTHPEGYLAHMFGGGFDPMRHPRDRVMVEAMAIDGINRRDSGAYGYGSGITVGEVIDRATDLRRNPLLVCGDPATVADKLEQWMEDYDLDGYLLRNFVHPGTVKDFGELVVPELQRRGRYRQEYEGTTLRENLFGAGHTKLAPTHPGAIHRPRTVVNV
jgi:FMN-dependent oxidoreductase (nitrilotriacetate monooxygenase family)